MKCSENFKIFVTSLICLFREFADWNKVIVLNYVRTMHKKFSEFINRKRVPLKNMVMKFVCGKTITSQIVIKNQKTNTSYKRVEHVLKIAFQRRFVIRLIQHDYRQIRFNSKQKCRSVLFLLTDCNVLIVKIKSKKK